MKNKIKALHPGEVLLEESIKPLGISQYKLAKDIDVSQIFERNIFSLSIAA